MYHLAGVRDVHKDRGCAVMLLAFPCLQVHKGSEHIGHLSGLNIDSRYSFLKKQKGKETGGNKTEDDTRQPLLKWIRTLHDIVVTIAQIMPHATHVSGCCIAGRCIPAMQHAL